MTDISHRLTLAGFQQMALDGLVSSTRHIAGLHHRAPEARETIAREAGVMLLQSPTGSGKTLVLGRTLEALNGNVIGKFVWFWFAPFTGLVEQTRSALASQCAGLRLRTVAADRDPEAARDGDVYVQTWAAVAASNKQSKTVRRDSESALSLDDMLEALREKGFLIGVVIDEAHLNFGASAQAAADFYLKVLRPDATILATATPNDSKLEDFERKAGIKVESRIEIARNDVVSAGLNKKGLVLGHVTFKPEDAELIDAENAALTAAWKLNEAIRGKLLESGIDLTPLMLVQVEDKASGDGEDPIARVEKKLIEIGVPKDAIAKHSSGEPDPDFHLLAQDETRSVLIFKLAAATGFDAPRAWTLVSVRPSRGPEFGLQLVGRIMRVHPSVRAMPDHAAELDRGYVIIVDPETQLGITAAAETLKAVTTSMELLTDELDVKEYLKAPETVVSMPTPAELAAGIEKRLQAGLFKPSILTASPMQQAAALAATREYAASEPFMFVTPSYASTARSDKNETAYKLRNDLGLPTHLIHEVPPDSDEYDDDFVAVVAREFCERADVLKRLNVRFRQGTLSMKDVLDHFEAQENLRVNLSQSRLADRAQLVLDFNDSIDSRSLRRALLAAIEHLVNVEGISASPEDLRRGLNLALIQNESELKEAFRIANARHVSTKAVELPLQIYGEPGLEPARKSAFGVFTKMNNYERQFADLLDGDETGTVKWWLKNPEKASWATRLVRPNGRNFYPDFAVGVSGRRSEVALVEIKDDPGEGRINSEANVEKFSLRHKEYLEVIWTFPEEKKWYMAKLDRPSGRLITDRSFRIEDLRG